MGTARGPKRSGSRIRAFKTGRSLVQSPLPFDRRLREWAHRFATRIGGHSRQARETGSRRSIGFPLDSCKRQNGIRVEFASLPGLGREPERRRHEAPSPGFTRPASHSPRDPVSPPPARVSWHPPGLIPRRRRSSSRARCRGHGPLAHIETAPAARKGRRPGHSAGLEQWEAHPTPAVWACCGPIHVRSARGGSGPGGAAGAEVACSIESDSIARKHRRECVSSGRSETAFSVTGRIASERHFGFRGGRLTALRASGGDAIIPGL